MSGLALTSWSNIIALETVEMYNRTGSALAVGETVAVDLTGSASEATAYSSFDTSTDKDSESPFRNVITLAAAHDDGWVIAVAMEAIADNAVGKFALKGVVDIKVADSLAIGARLAPSSSTATSLVGEADGVAICGILLEANASGGIAARPVLFDGFCFAGPQAEV